VLLPRRLRGRRGASPDSHTRIWCGRPNPAETGSDLPARRARNPIEADPANTRAFIEIIRPGLRSGPPVRL